MDGISMLTKFGLSIVDAGAALGTFIGQKPVNSMPAAQGTILVIKGLQRGLSQSIAPYLQVTGVLDSMTDYVLLHVCGKDYKNTEWYKLYNIILDKSSQGMHLDPPAGSAGATPGTKAAGIPWLAVGAAAVAGFLLLGKKGHRK